MTSPADVAESGDLRIKVSVVMACRNAAAYVAEQLDALAAQSYTDEWELIVSDNGSTDRSTSIVEEHRHRFPSLTLLDSSAHQGPGAARNAAVHVSRGEYLLFCDADDVVGSGWLSALSHALDEHDFVAAQLDHERLNDSSSTRKFTPHGGLLQSGPPFLPYMLGAALGVRRSIHDRVGGFDEQYRGSGEDRDYCYRIQLAGVQLVPVPEAVVHYRHRRTNREIFRQARGSARGHVQLYVNYRDLGLARPSALRAVVHWGLIPVRLIPAVTSRRRFKRWVDQLGWRIGRLEGSVFYRVWAP
jgi:GT2 family glycosyltransferase